MASEERELEWFNFRERVGERNFFALYWVYLFFILVVIFEDKVTVGTIIVCQFI